MKHVHNSTGHELKLPNIVGSSGVFVIDDADKRYMDLESGVWCTSIGHNNPRVNRAISRQCAAVMQSGFSYSSPIVDVAARRVLDIVDIENGKCIFLCSGSEAIEVLRQISRHTTGRRRSMTLHDSYLGAYSTVRDRTRDWHVLDWTQCRSCERSDSCRKECPFLKGIPEDISEFVFEPGSSGGLVRFPPVSMVKNIVAIVRERGGKILVNEVTTGVGRTGRWFGYQHYAITPDLIAIGKGIGSGYPVSVAVMNAETVEQLRDGTFRYAQSHQNDPLGAAVVKEVIDIIEEGDLIRAAADKHTRFYNQLSALVDGSIVTDVRGRGLMFAVDMCDEQVAGRVHDALIDRGFIVGNRGTSFRIDPPLTITDNEFSQFIDALRDTIREVRIAAQRDRMDG